MKHQSRKARISDVPALHRLINSFAERDQMLPRSLNEIYENLRDYVVMDANGEVIACCALHVTWEDLAELRSLAVREDYRGQGRGGQLVASCLEEARALGLPRVFVLTYIPGYFERFGFRLVQKSDLPHKVWSECIRCPKFPDCGEVGMILDLD